MLIWCALLTRRGINVVSLPYCLFISSPHKIVALHIFKGYQIWYCFAVSSGRQYTALVVSCLLLTGDCCHSSGSYSICSASLRTYALSHGSSLLLTSKGYAHNLSEATQVCKTIRSTLQYNQMEYLANEKTPVLFFMEANPNTKFH